MMVIPETNRMQ